jgi:hypothetical protein
MGIRWVARNRSKVKITDLIRNHPPKEGGFLVFGKEKKKKKEIDNLIKV